MLEKLIEEIMLEAEKDGEPVTYDEAKEMAEMELKAKDNVRRYEMEKPTVSRKKERKIDADKKAIFDTLLKFVGTEFAVDTFKNETEIEFTFNDCHYSVKLIKHRPPKK